MKKRKYFSINVNKLKAQKGKLTKNTKNKLIWMALLDKIVKRRLIFATIRLIL